MANTQISAASVHSAASEQTAQGTTTSSKALLPGEEGGTGGSTQNTLPMPTFLASIEEMVSTMGSMMEALTQYANVNNVSSMAISQAETSAQLANLSNVNEQMEQAQEEQEKEDRWGWIGKAFSAVVSICLIPLDPALGVTMLGGSTLNISGATQDIVGWISEGLQDLFPDLTSSDCKFLADVVLVATVVTAAVVIGVVTAGAGDVAIAEVAAEATAEELEADALEAVTEEVEELVEGEANQAASGAVEGATGSTVSRTVENTATKSCTDAASRLKKNRVKRGFKFATLLGSQAVMGTNIAPHAVAALASNVSSTPDSMGWKIAEAAAFAVEILVCLFASFTAVVKIDAPSAFDERFKGSSKLTKVRKITNRVAIGAGFAEAFSDSVAGYNGSKVGANYAKMSSEVEAITQEKIDTEMVSESNGFVQKNIEEEEKSLYDHNFASFADGGATISQQIA